MIATNYIVRPQFFKRVQLTAADAVELLAFLKPNYGIIRDDDGHWMFPGNTGLAAFEADDGDWLTTREDGFILQGIDPSSDPGFQQVGGTDVNYVVE